MKQEHAAGAVSTLLTNLKACSSRRDLQWGRRIHAYAVANREISNMHVATALIKMYAKCGRMAYARRLFDNLQKPDLVSWNALLLGYAANGDGCTVLDLFSKMKAGGFSSSAVTYVAAVKACTCLGAMADSDCLKLGRQIHMEIGRQLDRFVKCTLVDMYAKFGAMVEARRVFDTIEKQDVVSWTALLLGYAEHGEGQIALDLFSKMKAEHGCAPNSVTYVAALKACISLANDCSKSECLLRGREIHLEIGCHMDSFVQSTLIDMYAKCGSMVEARLVFDRIQIPNVVSWNNLLLGYAENGEELVALDMFSRMKALRECVPDSVTYMAALKACTLLAVTGDCSVKEHCLERGREIHSEIGRHLNHHVQSLLIDMYAKCGSMLDAHRVFDSMPSPDVVSWNALLLGYAENGEDVSALELFSRMKAHGCPPDSVTHLGALKACRSSGNLLLARKIQSDVSQFTVNVVTCFVDLYARCGSMAEALDVFDMHPEARNVTTWNALLAGYASFGETGSVFSLFKAMEDEDLQPNAVTFMCLLLCCSHAGLVQKAREYFQAMPVQYQVTPGVMHYTCMVDVLGRANQLVEAIAVLRRMPCSPNAVTWLTLLGACRKWKNVEIGRLASQSLVVLDRKNAAAYLSMEHIYGSQGMLDLRTSFSALDHSAAGETTNRNLEKLSSICAVDFKSQTKSRLDFFSVAYEELMVTHSTSTV